MSFLTHVPTGSGVWSIRSLISQFACIPFSCEPSRIAVCHLAGMDSTRDLYSSGEKGGVPWSFRVTSRYVIIFSSSPASVPLSRSHTCVMPACANLFVVSNITSARARLSNDQRPRLAFGCASLSFTSHSGGSTIFEPHHPARFAL